MTETYRTKCVLLVIDRRTGSPAEKVSVEVYGDGGWLVCEAKSDHQGLITITDPEHARALYMAEVTGPWQRTHRVGLIAWEESDGTLHDNPQWPRRHG